ncbi:hypothetical protein MC885_019360 [Smutsia gigantea]|nr:hypothetical protein MC885_019360 [Smutsia gigantea]
MEAANLSWRPPPSPFPWAPRATAAAAQALVGSSVTILRVRALHRVPHNLVASTAESDVLAAALVVPRSLVSEPSARRHWRLRRSLRHVWISFDVLSCAASPWNVAAIALDRYGTITRHLQHTVRAQLRAHRPGATALRLGRGERRSAPALPGEPGALLRRLLHLRRLLLSAWRGAVCLLEDGYKAAKFRFGRRRRAVLPGLGKGVAAGGKPGGRKSRWRKLALLGSRQRVLRQRIWSTSGLPSALLKRARAGRRTDVFMG